LGYFCNLPKKQPEVNNHPIGEKSPNLVTLVPRPANEGCCCCFWRQTWQWQPPDDVDDDEGETDRQPPAPRSSSCQLSSPFLNSVTRSGKISTFRGKIVTNLSKSGLNIDTFYRIFILLLHTSKKFLSRGQFWTSLKTFLVVFPKHIWPHWSAQKNQKGEAGSPFCCGVDRREKIGSRRQSGANLQMENVATLRFFSRHSSLSVSARVARWFVFKQKKTIWVNLGGP
jgi:hypothetical protein